MPAESFTLTYEEEADRIHRALFDRTAPELIRKRFAAVAPRLEERADRPLREYDPRDLPRTTSGNASLLKLPGFPQAGAALLDQYAAAFEKVLAHADDLPRETA